MADQSPWKNSTVLITGVCGSVGSEVLRQLTGLDTHRIIGVDIDENNLFFLNSQYADQPAVQLYLADVREAAQMLERTRGVDVIVHAAALKHVALNERSPRLAVQTNILGTQNIIDAAFANGVSRVLFTSSDKAVNPTNVMGTSKMMGERLMTAGNFARGGDSPIFVSTRFGNVMGSRGSVIPIFREQISRGGPVTVTDSRMTRFIMSIEEAVQLILGSIAMAQGGEVFVTKMPVVAIPDLAKVMIDELAPSYGYRPEEVEIREIGSRPGEKLYEELLSEEEVRRAVELTNFFAVLPAFGPSEPVAEQLEGRPVTAAYNSLNERAMDHAELKSFLREWELLAEAVSS